MTATAGLRVLVCEDEGLTALRLQKSLQALGFLVAGEARDGEEAVSRAVQLRPDVILMDIRMPRCDGIAAVERIMAEAPTTIVMVTAFSENELVQRALEAGASGYLVKPVTDEQLQPAIAVALSRFRQFQELNGQIRDLSATLEARKIVERAKGVLMRRRNLTEEEAYQHLQRISRDRRQPMKDTAAQVIAAVELLGA